MKNSYKNIFRRRYTSIHNHFIISYTGSQENNDLYIESNLPHKWIRNNKNFKIISGSDYEKTLMDFFETTDDEEIKQRMIIIVGGVGSGKSSAINYTIKESKLCNSCVLNNECSKNFPQRVLVDFIDFKNLHQTQRPIEEERKIIKERQENFWNHIYKIIEASIDTKINSSEEVSIFWPWLIDNHPMLIPKKIDRLFTANRQLLEAPARNSNALLKIRENIILKSSYENLTYYSLFKIGYLRKDNKVNCNLLVFDNIDTLEPHLQDQLIDFAEKAYRILGCRSVLPMRPHTYSMMHNHDVSDFLERILHCKPSLAEVFDKRLDQYKLKGDNDVYESLKNIFEIVKSNPLFRKIFANTSGLSIRHAFRNFMHFIQSPHIITHENGVRVDIQMNTNSFFQTYFCGKNENQLLDEGHFLNIISQTQSSSSRYFSNLKIRILHLLFNNESIYIEDLLDILHSFGYKDAQITTTVNELLNFKRALMWSTAQNSYTKKEIARADRHQFEITHLGKNYFKKLLQEPMYLRECIYSIKNHRDVGKEESINNVLSALRDLFEIEKREIANFIRKKSVEEYKELFIESDKISISEIIWCSVRDNLLKWKGVIETIDIDQKRNHYINKEVQKILSPPK